MQGVMRKLMAGLAVGGLVLAAGVGAADEKKKDYSIPEIMKKGHGAKGLLKGIAAHAKGGEWDEAKTDAALLTEFGVQLEKSKPEKGSDESWKKLAGVYKEQTAAVAVAVDKKDAKGTEASLKKITGSCKSCHDQHK